ncbi:8-oxo-dGTP diphosphatase [Candidatus Dojkabacteria bacterium]|uniref:Oxidized purine nucleoside triphosphate hydrolase n=1 Tax=Candidatus Dojkabacteria bacterium TaxID=2099670 RepID=A0A955L971_9BACT|nr:8-oxo-dGTP diphosphatase [Candidatus Dojkabacteria bacterium]
MQSSNIENVMADNKNLPIRCVTYLMESQKVLLGHKKEGMGNGMYMGVGGKQKKGETFEETARRELKEEITVEADQIQKCGQIHFYFPHKPSWSQTVIPFICTKWSGEPTETEEMIPKWFKIEELPIHSMWPDAKYWVPFMLEGRILEGHFVYNTEDAIESFKISTL